MNLMKMVLTWSVIFAALAVTISCLFPYQCGLWDSLSGDGAWVVGIISCRGFPLPIFQAPDTTHLGDFNLVLFIASFSIYTGIGIMLISLLRLLLQKRNKTQIKESIKRKAK